MYGILKSRYISLILRFLRFHPSSILGNLMVKTTFHCLLEIFKKYFDIVNFVLPHWLAFTLHWWQVIILKLPYLEDVNSLESICSLISIKIWLQFFIYFFLTCLTSWIFLKLYIDFTFSLFSIFWTFGRTWRRVLQLVVTNYLFFLSLALMNPNYKRVLLPNSFSFHLPKLPISY